MSAEFALSALMFLAVVVVLAWRDDRRAKAEMALIRESIERMIAAQSDAAPCEPETPQ